MKRRDFLKSVVGVVAGAVIAPVIIKAKTKPAVSGCPSSPSISVSSMEKSGPLYPLGTRKIMADGRVFRYCQNKKKGFIEENGQVIGVGSGDGWMQTWGFCVKPANVPENPIFGMTSLTKSPELIHLNINV